MKSSDLLDDFTQFCVDNPELDFWWAIKEFKDKYFFRMTDWPLPEGAKVQKMDYACPDCLTPHGEISFRMIDCQNEYHKDGK